jgi:hypothetical protein
MMTNDALSGEELNGRLDELMIAIERVSILLDEARLDPNDMLALDAGSMEKLIELLEDYGSFLGLFRDTTVDTVATIKSLTTVPGSRCGGPCDEDKDIDIDDGEE